MKNKGGQLLIHIIGCLVFLTLPFLFTPNRAAFVDRFSDLRSLKELISYSLLIVFFYLNFLVFVPKLYFSKHYFYYGMVVLISYALIVILPELFMPFKPFPLGPSHKMPPPPPDFIFFRFSHNFFLFLVVGLFSLMLRISNQWKQSEREKLNTELLYLKAQINPHFLFNTLNSIYSLAIDKSDHTAPAVVKLSAMMRYVISEADKDFVPLAKEIAYVQSYIELQQIRFGDAVQVKIEVSGEPLGKKIAPLILIPFIENAFKHGVNAEDNSSISIRIDVLKTDLVLLVVNNKVHIEQPAEEQPGGLGIVNTKNRLKLLYPGRHTLSVQETDHEYSVSLVLTL
jgi:hypothetical protein